MAWTRKVLRVNLTAGTCAPVKMRAAVPGCKGCPTWPAGMRCDTGSTALPLAASAARSA